MSTNLKFLSGLFLIIRHEVSISLQQAFEIITPLLFFVIVICLFPLALGPDTSILNKIAPGIIWVAALLAILIAIGNIFQQDAQTGFLDLLFLSAYPLTLLVTCKIISHWLTHCVPLILLSPLLGVMLHLNAHEIYALMFSLTLGTPVLILLGSIGAALLIGIKGNGLLLPILIMPLYIPVLIFGTGMISAASTGQSLSAYFAIMTAFVFLTLAFAPLLIALALRNGVA